MKTLRREEKAEEAEKPEPEEEAAPAPAWPAGSFTARELDAAQQLVLLSGSSTSTGATTTGPAASGSSSSSSRSVNAPPRAPATPEPKAPLPAAERTVVQEERGEKPEVDWERRPGRRYRLIAEIYEATEEIE
ncbi:hypothetical protein E2562_004723 [Oryza meyeriana var. granulata]|uniref:Uncharacterized protein n=1 Tax=Oryza meyeriana var. granulata TaxID=110450 RepID=A0A6G1DE12_9ORYZ|nr:hypothetical protein E2562_004723 [Oryza meyeriana var. granulata]